MIKRLEECCDIKINAKLGHQGGTIPCTINWSSTLGLWFYCQKLEESRYWNAFGYSKIPPKENSTLPIIVEINPPIEGINRSVQGAFMVDAGKNIHVAYRGKIGGGRSGVGRDLFFKNYSGPRKFVNSDKFIIISKLNDADFCQKVTNFVQQVDRIKHLPR